MAQSTQTPIHLRLGAQGRMRLRHAVRAMDARAARRAHTRSILTRLTDVAANVIHRASEALKGARVMFS